jgi:uncharacterized protein
MVDHVRSLALLVAWLACLAIPVAIADEGLVEEQEAGGSLSILLVTGGCCHDYDRQTVILREGLSKRLGPVQWTIAQYGTDKDIEADVYRAPDWAEDFDLVIHNECFGDVKSGSFVEGIVQGHVRAGVPAILLHCTMHSYRASDAADSWRAFLGVTSRRHERRKGSMKVVAQEADHPALQGFPSPWNTPNGELYIIEKVWPTATVLATAYSSEEEADQPVIWTNQYEGVRVFGTTIGHHNETMEHPVWLDTVARGAKWAVGRE